MDCRSYIKPTRRLTARDRNIENNDHSNMYQRLAIEERWQKLGLRDLGCDPPDPGRPTVLEVNRSRLECRGKDVSSLQR